MAISTCLFKLEWENGNLVKLGRKDEGEGSYLTIFEMEENGSWADWTHIASIMNSCFARKVDDIGDTMKG